MRFTDLDDALSVSNTEHQLAALIQEWEQQVDALFVGLHFDANPTDRVAVLDGVASRLRALVESDNSDRDLDKFFGFDPESVDPDLNGIPVKFVRLEAASRSPPTESGLMSVAAAWHTEPDNFELAQLLAQWFERRSMVHHALCLQKAGQPMTLERMMRDIKGGPRDGPSILRDILYLNCTCHTCGQVFHRNALEDGLCPQCRDPTFHVDVASGEHCMWCPSCLERAWVGRPILGRMHETPDPKAPLRSHTCKCVHKEVLRAGTYKEYAATLVLALSRLVTDDLLDEARKIIPVPSRKRRETDSSSDGSDIDSSSNSSKRPRGGDSPMQ